MEVVLNILAFGMGKWRLNVIDMEYRGNRVRMVIQVFIKRKVF